MTMRDDYHVDYRSEGTIAQFAEKLRAKAGHRNSAYFNIKKYVEDLQNTWSKSGKFIIETFDMKEGEKPAYVEFNPPTLHIDREVWEMAGIGDPEARFIVAHELGHLFLHDHHAKAFSVDPAERITFSDKEHSAEWQANTFAAHFLLPDNIVSAHYDVEELVSSCGVSKDLAEERLAVIIDRDRRRRHSGICRACGDFVWDKDGTCTSDVCSDKRVNSA